MIRYSFIIAFVLVLSGCGTEEAPQKNVSVPDTSSEAEAVQDTLNFGPINKLNLNEASLEDFGRVPGSTPKMVREFDEYRPYISITQFRREMAKYIEDDVIAAYENYLYVPVDYNESDLATIMQISGVSEAMAQSLMDGRPYASSDAFLAQVTEVAGGISEQFARHYLIQE
ncbi:MAG: hypothetical protein HOC28_08785 [Bacteroidetes Order II. Incertae sedis bacterium]|jgi:DNA uptake protein ComE-like DNA-binding protein|nr:hypothetical protein [Bacteroidetes Order II. bacterium]MBT4051473.1 hypothetical protein [Bacteroidetes Order II. bacterium]MBT4603221.1 hypothetical protein [Bacteroidetes Order II. bacterium]MBT5250393.1 hypothetical protein [Bacteroidetes Order II. bacterium]MBT6201170.1 hypothetical protein [Bacteroidetes Order II. bacterium]